MQKIDFTRVCTVGYDQIDFQRKIVQYICSGTFQKANNKDADQTARIRRLVCAWVIRNTPKAGFSRVEAHIIQAKSPQIKMSRIMWFQ